MKLYKLGLMVFTCVLAANVNAQDEQIQNKNGVDILPEKGDFALGFNAVPLLNLIGTPTTGAPKFLRNLFNNQVVSGKYMLSNNTAVRANFNFQIDNFNNQNFVQNDVANSPDSLIADGIKVKNQLFVIGGGYEVRKGKGRIQAIYGADLAFSFGRSRNFMTYGNGFGQTNPTPTSTSWSSSGAVISEVSMGERTVSRTSGNMFGIGLRPFVGVEYFFAPRISIGAEFSWNLTYQTTAEGTEVTELYTQGDTYHKETPSGRSRRFNTGIDNLGGAVTLLFYF